MKKQYIIRRIISAIEGSSAVLVYHYGDLKPQQWEEVREELVKIGYNILIIKNKLLTVALKSTKYQNLSLLAAGPTCVVFGAEIALCCTLNLINPSVVEGTQKFCCLLLL